jgi:hypothetical protein
VKGWKRDVVGFTEICKFFAKENRVTLAIIDDWDELPYV